MSDIERFKIRLIADGVEEAVVERFFRVIEPAVGRLTVKSIREKIAVEEELAELEAELDFRASQGELP